MRGEGSTVARARPAIASGAARGPAVALVAFVAVLPLEWTTVGGVAGGFIKPFHIAAIVFVGFCLARWRPGRVVGPVWHRHYKIFAAYFVVLAVTLAASVARPDPVLPRDLVLRQLMYAATAVFVAGCLVLILNRPAQRALAATGAIATVVLLAVFGVALVQQHINPFTLLSNAFTQANPDIISYQLLRAVFRTDLDLPEVSANLRHKVFIGLLIAIFVGLACAAILERQHRLLRATVTVSSVIGFSLVLLSLSRSTILCMGAPLLLYLLRLLVTARARPAQAFGLVVALAATLAAVASPLGTLLTARFSDTASYTARLTAAGPSFLDQFGPAALLGTTSSAVGTTPHNSILNAWLAGGVLAAIPAAVMMVAFVLIWLREAHRYVTNGPGWKLWVEPLWILAVGATFIVRSFTSGNQFHMVDLTAMAVFLGATFANERATVSSRESR